MSKDLCGKCGKKPVLVKKWGLCVACYQSAYAKNTLAVTRHSKANQTFRMHHREIVFASQHLSPGWDFEPARFILRDGTAYTPDFWDAKRKSFLELVGTRQAYSSNRDKYALFRAQYPTVPFLIVNAENTEIHGPESLPEENGSAV